jgi:quercetin dioxygenase-like cupin family protein
MLVRRADEMEGSPVRMEGAERVAMRLMVGRADGAPNFALRHDYEHEVYVVEGSGRIEQNGELHDLAPGDVAFVRPNALHQFVNTGDGPFKFLCIVPVSFDCGKPTPGS